MKNSFFIISGAILIATLSTGCRKLSHCVEGQGPVITSEVYMAVFSRIEVQGNIDVFVSQGEKQYVEVTGQSNLVDRLETSVSGETWRIRLKEKYCYSGDRLSVNIIIPNISEVNINGSGDVDMGAFSGQSDVSLHVNGSGEIKSNGFGGTENLDVNINGSGNVTVRSDFPNLQQLKIAISGSGEYKGFPCSTERCEIAISGSGNVSTTVNSNLDVRISGSGDVHYKGNPVITSKISGSGRLVHVD